MLGNRASQHNFAKAPQANIQRSQFDRSFTVKDAFDFDKLVPIFLDEVLPGDTCNVSLNMFARLATQIVPIMDNMYLDFFFFFVPNRLVWDNWEKFNGAQDNPGDSTSFLVPQINMGGVAVDPGTNIADKFGIPTGVTNLSFNALPFRAYKLIWNQWFRDENLQTSQPISKGDGPDSYATSYQILPRGKARDYFTSSLPWPQKGPSINVPGPTSSGLYPSYTVPGNTGLHVLYAGVTTGALVLGGSTINPGGTPVVAESGLINGTINQLREAFAIQSLMEADARGGTRYTEIIQQHFNVTSPDFRLQRAEYLGGGKVQINSHPVAQTTPTAGGSPQAKLAAFGTASSQSSKIGFTKSFVEHGYVIGMVSARADLTYQQGLNKLWSRRTRFDFFWPKLQELGEQSVLNSEIYAQGTAADTAVFGYQERYAEYRYKPSEIHGIFRSQYATAIDYWHLAEEFFTLPALNANFVPYQTPIARAIAISTEPHLLFDGWFNYKHARPMVTYAVPMSLGRF